MKKKITYATLTDKGGRTVNEDSINAISDGERFGFVLCDGLGGHGMGDVASGVVVNEFESYFKNSNSDSKISDFFEQAQAKLLGEQKKLGATNRMKTTAVVVQIENQKLFIGHIGDSRAYIFKNNKYKKRTLDHSVPQMLVLSKSIKDEEIRNHPDRNMVLHVLGTAWTEPQYEIMKPSALRKSDAILLCSDGFWELITEKQMCECLKLSTDVEDWLFKMAEIVRENGKNVDMDNYSAIAVWNKK